MVPNVAQEDKILNMAFQIIQTLNNSIFGTFVYFF